MSRSVTSGPVLLCYNGKDHYDVLEYKQPPITRSSTNKEQLMPMPVNADLKQAKQILGDRLYPLILVKQPQLASTISNDKLLLFLLIIITVACLAL